jgi:hypothetical protein
MDWRRPSGNTGRFDMTGDGNIIDASWLTPTTNIPGHLLKMNAALQELVGSQLDMIICPANVWAAVVNNDAVREQAGISETPFSVYERMGGTAGEGSQNNTMFRGVIRAVPWITWYVVDEGLQVPTSANPEVTTFEKFVPDNYIYWGPNPTGEFFQMLNGSEPVNEGYGKDEVERFGAYAYTKMLDNPAGRQMFAGDNCIPANYIPKSNGYGTVIF